MRRQLRRHGGKNAGSANMRKPGISGGCAGRSALFAFVAFFGAASGGFAADLSLPGPTPPVYDWTGLYVGGNLGAGWGGLSDTNFSDTLGSSFTGSTNTQFAGGAQVGANYQFWGGVVIGAEAMFDWFTVSHNNPVTATDPTGTVAANVGPVDARWATTLTGKFGYAWDRVLLYGKGGGAWVATTSPSISIAGGGPASFSSVNNTTTSTWTVGFGLEWAFSGNWSARAEYDYIALPNQSLTVAPATPIFGGDVISFNNRNLSIFTAALNYNSAAGGGDAILGGEKENKMRRTKVSRLAQAPAAVQAGNIFAVTGAGVVQSGRGEMSASASVSTVGAAENGAGRTAITLAGMLAAVCACAALPTLAHAQPGEGSIAVASLPQDLSPWGMFQHANTIVKAVMIGLAAASLVTWTVWVAKSIELLGARAAVRRGFRMLAESATFARAHEKLRDGKGPVARLVQAAADEIRLSANLRADGLKERIAWQSERIEMAAGRKISRGTGVLATIGATAPFVGLFGTVWGIMDSFIGISKAHTTNLAVVAPGIAEALLATALGLVAAIPAVMIYNVLARSTAHYRALIGDASAQVMKLVSRDLDRAALGKSGLAAKPDIVTQAAE